MIKNIAQQIVKGGGKIIPLIVPFELGTNGTGLCNPTILVDNNDIWVNVRHVQYTLHHTMGKYKSRFGPLAYLNPDNDFTLTTKNYLGKLVHDNFEQVKQVDMKLDVQPIWEFVGLEDARLVKWNDKMYLTGVRRDTTPNGEGRMELSEIKDWEEVSRERIPSTNPDAYCEKNWMPILDLPYHYMKWMNPVEIVFYDGIDTHIRKINDWTIPMVKDLRGGSQIVKIGEYYYCVAHETNLWINRLNQKDATYRNRLVKFDKYFNIIDCSDEFTFMDGLIEFTCGLAVKDNWVYITFGVADNAAYVAKLGIELFYKLFYE